MIIRIVHFKIKEACRSEFELKCLEMSQTVVHTEGCLELNIIKDIGDATEYKTVSKWSSETALNTYRASDRFLKFWKGIKPLFEDRAKAESYDVLFTSD